MGTMATRAGAAVAAVLLAAGLAACGDDEETSDAGDAPAGEGSGGDTGAFCSALVEFNGAVLGVELDDSSSAEDITAAGEQLAPLMQTIADNAPDDLAGTADELNSAVAALQDGDATAFNADDTFLTYTEFVDGAVGECDFDTVEVTLADYAFEGLPETMEAGTYAFALTNSSDVEDHEMVMVRKADGVTQSIEELLELPEEEAGSMVEFLGAGFAPPGGEGSALVELTPGDYAVVCFIPVGGGEEGPPHFTQGMAQEFTVS
jgi:hypothetical protein